MFSVSTKTQYGIRALAYLAKKESHEATTSEIAASEGISPKYLEGIMNILNSAGLIRSERGKKGGVRLLRIPSTMTMREIVEALGGAVTPVECLQSTDDCVRTGACLPRRFWVGLKEAIDGYLESKTLEDIAQP